jgi:hypothetical protein
MYMDVKKFIDTIIREVAYRTDSGTVNLRDKRHISILSEVLIENDMLEIKDELIRNLLGEADDKKFDNPDLNKVVSYTDTNGEEKEGIVGNLLRQPKDTPPRDAAERALGNDERKIQQALQDLGYENAPDGDSTPGDGLGGDGGQQQGTAFKGKGGDSYRESLPETDPASKKEKPSEKRIVAGKDKSLRKVDTLSTETFTQDLEPNDIEFKQRNEKIKLPTPPPPYQLPDGIKGKFPKKYLTALQRMMNTKPTKPGTEWSHYSDLPGGAGQISAQAGELITMMGVGMDDEDFQTFVDSLYQHERELIEKNPKLKPEGKRIVVKSWIQAAENNRKIIFNRIAKEHPGAEILATSWDTEADVEALGLDDYEKNKGFSTDMYVKLKTKDGKEILDEISLKKSKDVNFLNSGAGKFSDWDENIPDDINMSHYVKTQREKLADAAQGLKPVIDSVLESDSEKAQQLKKIFNAKKVDFQSAFEQTKAGKGNRAKSKVLQEAIKTVANWPDFPNGKPLGGGEVMAVDYLNDVKDRHTEYQTKAIKAITDNPKMKEGMLNEIRQEFPLKAVSDGEETMAIGDMSLDRNTMKEIFGTSDYDQIKENLTAQPGPPPFLGYRAEVGDNIIPIATIVVRQDGVGYGPSVKFEMKLNKDFAKILKKATEKVYD